MEYLISYNKSQKTECLICFRYGGDIVSAISYMFNKNKEPAYINQYITVHRNNIDTNKVEEISLLDVTNTGSSINKYTYVKLPDKSSDIRKHHSVNTKDKMIDYNIDNKRIAKSAFTNINDDSKRLKNRSFETRCFDNILLDVVARNTFYEKYKSVSINNKSMFSEYYWHIFLYQKPMSIPYNDSRIGFCINNKNIVFHDYISLNKSKELLSYIEYKKTFQKYNDSMHYTNNNLFFKKNSNSIYKYNRDISTFHSSKPVVYFDSNFVNKTNSSMAFDNIVNARQGAEGIIFRETTGIVYESKAFNLRDNVYFKSNIKWLDMPDTLYHSKSSNVASINGTIYANSSSNRKLLFNKTMYFNKVSKDFRISNNYINLTKKKENLTISKYIINLLKKRQNSNIRDEVYNFTVSPKVLTGLYKDSAVSFIRYLIPIRKHEVTFGDLICREAYMIKKDFVIWASTYSGPADVNINVINVSRSDTGIYENNLFFINKEDIGTYCNTDIAVKDTAETIDLKNNISVKKPIKHSDLLDSVFGYKYISHYDYPELVNAYAIPRAIKLDKIEFVHYMPLDGIDFDFTSIREDIDELILPHYNYDYKRTITNDDGTLDFSFVKGYDSELGMLILNMPIEHPIEIFSSLALEYVDVNVKILEHTMFLIRNIWRENIYKYNMLSARDSIEHMLIILVRRIEELTSAVDKENDRHQYLRCMKLFKWYSEMAILNNCEYLLKFKTEAIAPNYNEMSISELEEYMSLDNLILSEGFMFERKFNSLRSTVTIENTAIIPISVSMKLYIESTKISISTYSGAVKSTIEYGDGIHNVTVNVSDLASIDIMRDGYACIGSVKINVPTDDFTVKYKGTIGESNSVFEEILDKYSIFKYSSEEISKFNNSYPMTVAIQKIRDYFELHHKNKLKGKRLVTKR